MSKDPTKDPNALFAARLGDHPTLKIMVSGKAGSSVSSKAQKSVSRPAPTGRRPLRRANRELLAKKKKKLIGIYDFAQISNGVGGWDTPVYDVLETSLSDILPLANAPLGFSLGTWPSKYKKIDPLQYRLSAQVNGGPILPVASVPLTSPITDFTIHPYISSPYRIFESPLTQAKLFPEIRFAAGWYRVTALPDVTEPYITFSLASGQPFNIYINPAVFQVIMSDDSVVDGSSGATTEDLPYPAYKWLNAATECPFAGEAGAVSLLNYTENHTSVTEMFKTKCIVWDRSVVFDDVSTTTDPAVAKNRVGQLLADNGAGNATNNAYSSSFTSQTLIRTDGFPVSTGDHVCPPYTVDDPTFAESTIVTASTYHDYAHDAINDAFADNQLLAVITQGTNTFYLWNAA